MSNEEFRQQQEGAYPGTTGANQAAQQGAGMPQGPQGQMGAGFQPQAGYGQMPGFPQQAPAGYPYAGQMPQAPQQAMPQMPPAASGGQMPMPMPTPQPQQPTSDVPGMLPVEESYIENILRLNKGKIATVYMTFENNDRWNAKVFKGVIEAAGRDHIILSDPETGRRYLLLMIYLDYITFDEELNYEYPFAAGSPTVSYPSR